MAAEAVVELEALDVVGKCAINAKLHRSPAASDGVGEQKPPADA